MPRFANSPTPDIIRRLTAPLIGLALLLAACGGGPADSPVVRLVDEFDPARVEGAPSGAASAPAIAWTFTDRAGGEYTWQASHGIADLRVEDGMLQGRTTDDLSILQLRRGEVGDPADAFHSIEVRLRVSRGERVALTYSSSDKVELDAAAIAKARSSTPEMNAAIEAGEEIRTVVLSADRPRRLGEVRTILLSPSDQAGATFAIESVKLVSQRENRASIPTGVGWQGLSSVFRESVVSRSPEVFTMDVDVPAGSWLDLHLGTLDEGPVTFRLEDVSGGEPALLLERTVTTPHRWEEAAVDLSGLTGRRTLAFSLHDVAERTVGFWGGPAIRVRGAKVSTPHQPAAALGGAEAPQGVIVLMCDTLRKDHLPMYGYDRNTSPNLASLSAGGTLFLDNISQATWTKASVPSMMSSLEPRSNRVHGNPDRLSATITTLAEVYREAGYATVSYSSVAFTGRLSNLHQGYEELHEADFGDPRPPQYIKTGRGYVDRATKWIERHRDTPFFMFLHIMDPHSPYEPRAPYSTRWSDPAGRPRHEADRDKAGKATTVEYRRSRGLPYREDLEHAGVEAQPWLDYEQGWYDGSILGMDAEIGRVIEQLRALGLDKRVLVVVVSDHGDELHDHGGMWHGQSVYGELNRVPLMFRWPGVVPGGLEVPQMVRNLDLMPTLLDLSGLEIPADVQGQSLVPLMASAKSGTDPASVGWKPLPAVTEKAADPHGENPVEFGAYGIIVDGWKLIHNTEGRGERPEFEFYNHLDDPLDQTNLAADEPDRVESLKAALDDWLQMTEAAMFPRGDSTEGLDAGEIDKLRSLGYIQ